MKTQLEVMLHLQDKMNQKVHPHWIDQHFAWFRAIWIECGELVAYLLVAGIIIFVSVWLIFA